MNFDNIIDAIYIVLVFVMLVTASISLLNGDVLVCIVSYLACALSGYVLAVRRKLF